MSYISSINKQTGNFMNYTVKNWFAKNLEQGIKQPAQYAAKMMVGSIVSKDIINCYYYTTQSYNNKKIPEEKRGFVAAMDFVNGVINVVGQIAAFMCVDKFLTPKIESFYTGKIKDAKTGEEKYVKSTATLSPDEGLRMTKEVIHEQKAELIKKGVDFDRLVKESTEVSKKIFDKVVKDGGKSKDLAKGIGIVVSSLATMALIKRTLTPLVATPLAGWFKDKYMNKKKPDAPHGRVYYEWKNTMLDNKKDGKSDNKIDKSAFGQFTTR